MLRFKHHYSKKVLLSKGQPWILLLAVIAICTAISCHQPTHKWLSETVNNNLLLSVTICVILFVKFVICRLYYVSKINEGHKDAQGCAGSSCLLTIILAICIIILTIKCCQQHYKPNRGWQQPKKVATVIAVQSKTFMQKHKQ